MSKAVDMAKVSVKGSFNILWGLVASTVISAVGSIVLAWVLGEANYGLYAIALTTPNLIGLFKDLGINSAVIRYSAQYKAENKTDEIRCILLSGLIFKALIGLILSLVCLLLAPYIATTVFSRPLLTPLIQIVSFTILTGALVATATAIFTGIEQMHLNSFMVVAQSLIKTILAPLLVVIGLSTYGAVWGFMIASIMAVLVAVLLIWVVYKNLPKKSSIHIKKTIKILLKFGLPLSFSTILTGFLTQFLSFILAIYVADNALIGNYNMALNFLVLLTFFAIPISTMLFPAFSKIDPKKEPQLLESVFKSSVKYTSLFVVPFTVMLMALAEPAVSTLFGDSYSSAPLLISLLAITYLYPAFGSFSAANLINTQEKARIKLLITLMTIAIGIPLGIILISTMGVFGLVITTLAAGIPTIVIGLLFVKKEYGITIDWLSSSKILFSSAISGILSYLVVIGLGFPSIVRLVIGIIVFLFAFLFMVLFTKVINKVDIDNLSMMMSSLGAVGRVVNYLLNSLKRFVK